MLDEFKKSVDKIFHERITSPLFGSFLFAWFIWNWKILYLTFFVSESKLKVTKLEYIVSNYSDVNSLIWYPLLSTAFIILLYPFLSTGAFWIGLKFTKWNYELKNKEENKKLLTLEQSIQLRQEIRNQEDLFDSLFKKKNEEIELLKKEIENYRQQLKDQNKNISALPVDTKEQLFEREFETLKNKPELFRQFEKIGPKALKEQPMLTEGSSIDRKLFDYFLANDYIVRTATNVYKLTEKGKFVHKKLIDQNLLNTK